MKKILVIQNGTDELNQIENLFSGDEYEIFYSHNKKDGLEISIRYLPDIILFLISDARNDIEFIKSILNNENTTTLPIIIISDNYSFEEQRTYMELGADDYIPLKFLEKSLPAVIRRKQERLLRLISNINKQINTFDEFNNIPGKNDHILVKIGNKLKLLKYYEIVCITALKEYSKIITNDNCKIIIRKSLKNWCKILPKNFLRIHRATIINMDCIDKIIKTNERTYTVHLKKVKDTFDFSHRYANVMRKTFPS